MLFKIIILVQVVAALAIIVLVLLQHGKGADMGAAFGSGASGSLFGATGSSNFLSKSTAVAAIIFFIATLVLAYVGHRPAQKATVTDQLETMTVAPDANTKKAEKTSGAGLVAIPSATTIDSNAKKEENK